MLSTAAFNALLKTLEEPPSHVVFLLCTTDPQKVPETIHSRCQRFDFRRIAPETMVSRLGAICMAEDVEFEGEALDLIAQRAEGGLRNALTSLEQIIAFENGNVTLAGAERLLGAIDSSDLAEIMTYVGRREIANCFRWTAAYVETGADLAQFVRDMAEHVRNLYVMALVGDDADLDVSETTRRQLASELQWFGADRSSRLLGVLGDLSAELKTSSNPRLSFEIALTRMVRPDSDLTIEALAERIEALESGYSSIAHVLSGKLAEAVGRSAAPVANSAETVSEAAPAQVVTAASEVRDPVAMLERQTATEELAETQATVPASQSAGGLDALANPAALQRIWQSALATVKREKQAYGVLFMNTKARFDAEAGALKVLFPAESAFAFNAVQKPDVEGALTEALNKAAGFAVPFAYEKAGGSPTAVQVSASQTAVQPVPAAELEPTPAVVPEPEPAVATKPEPKPAFQAEGAAYDGVPYEQVPYEDLAYDPVPYDEIEASAATPHPAAGNDAGAADIQAMLQEGFGGGVVFEEIDE